VNTPNNIKREDRALVGDRVVQVKAEADGGIGRQSGEAHQQPGTVFFEDFDQKGEYRIKPDDDGHVP